MFSAGVAGASSPRGGRKIERGHCGGVFSRPAYAYQSRIRVDDSGRRQPQRRRPTCSPAFWILSRTRTMKQDLCCRIRMEFGALPRKRSQCALVPSPNRSPAAEPSTFIRMGYLGLLKCSKRSPHLYVMRVAFKVRGTASGSTCTQVLTNSDQRVTAFPAFLAGIATWHQ